MIKTISEYTEKLLKDFESWPRCKTPWFRGESGDNPSLLPKISNYQVEKENFILQSFRRQAGSIANTPPRGETDKWLFFAQHYGIPTRLLDWTEGALIALYFAINKNNKNPRVYMINPYALNELATSSESDYLNFPLSWIKLGYENIALAWEERNPNRGFELPVAFPAIYQDQRMIAQRSCFTVHGKILKPLKELLLLKGVNVEDYLFEYAIDSTKSELLKRQLRILGISQATIFPDLDNLAIDLKFVIDNL
ncbi:MAG: FRG domain-containing protein [Candidatus Hodarchaeales archaeon]|jgi:hypothetical protein